MTVKEEIMIAVSQFPGITDTELERKDGRRHQAINAACRELVQKGYLVRQPNPKKGGLLGNYPTGKVPEVVVVTKPAISDALDEDAIKANIKDWLENQGWEVKIAWEKNHGVDIEATKSGDRWLIEVKGPGSRQAMRHNYFLGILGDTLQRMDDDNARYSIAFPEMAVYRELWNRLPKLAKQRTKIDMLLVDKDGHISILR
ncbi:MAG: MarR family transcriptional regulator [Christensenellaceae bacterium]|nr:MarR family transcriptional regulator [Christensenellaceae bacterium]